MRRLLLSIVLFVLFSIPVTAYGLSGIQHSYYTFPKCVGEYRAQVTSYSSIEYMLPGCTYTTPEKGIWTCPCSTNATILVKEGQAGSFDIRLQYYIDALKPVGERVNNIPTQAEVYNDNIRRIEYIKGVTIIEREGSNLPKEGQLENISSLVFFIVVIALVFIVISIIVIMLIFGFGKRIRRWLGVDEDEELTFKKILIAIFKRPNVSRKGIGNVRKTQQTPVQQKVKTPEKSSSSTEDEVRRILEEIGQ